MKQLIISKSNLNGNIKTISSKSLSHRYLLAASLAKGKSIIKNVLKSKDIEATTNILMSMGAKINIIDNDYYIDSNGLSYSPDDLDCFESGSTLRFFIPITWLFNESSTLIGKESLGSRSLIVYEDIAKEFGYLISKTNNNFPIITNGPLKSGTYTIDGSISSQFVTGLLYSLPNVQGNSYLKFNNEIASKKYIDLTIDVLKLSGIKINELTNGYEIIGNQKFKPINHTVEGDYSQASFFIVASILTNSQLDISNLNFMSNQGDKEILEIIKQFGANYKISNDSIVLCKDTVLKPAVIDLYNIPDLGPILMVLASKIEGTTIFKNIDRLFDKESNRYLAIKENLEKLGVIFEVTNNELKLTGNNEDYKGIVFNTYNDHRIAMALSVYALTSKYDVIINDYEVVSKSYPNFYLDLEKIGGEIKYVK